MKPALPLALVALLAACASAPESPTARDASSSILAQLLTGLPGDYSTATGGDAGQRVLRMAVRAETQTPDRQTLFSLTQFEDGVPPRRFLLQLGPGEQANELRGRFAPERADGQVEAYCELRFAIRSDGIAGRSNPADCRFGSGESAAGLLKEIAFDGAQLVIGDRLINLSSGEPLIADQIHAFHPVRRFQGWVGRLEHGAWRRSQPFLIDSSGAEAEPRDAAGMDLGLIIELHRHNLGNDGLPILRMTIRELQGEAVLGESWADPEAERIGIALPDLQIGLELQAPGR